MLLAGALIISACESDTPPAGNGNTSKAGPGETCVTDTDCTDNLTCTGTLGTQVCTQPGDGMVDSLCGNADHCADGLICDAGRCSTGVGKTCAADADCNDNLRCTGGTGDGGIRVCTQPGDGTVGSLCGTDDHCTDPLTCNGEQGLCSAGTTTTGNVGDTCTDDDSCTDPLVCGSDNECGVASTNSCSADTQCAAPLLCTGGTGAQSCNTAGDGLTGSVCGNNDHCDGALICGNGLCGVAAGGTCTVSDDCAGDLACGSGVCGNTCTTDNGCTGGQICTGTPGSQVCTQAGTGLSGSVCGNNDHCDGALLCVSGACDGDADNDSIGDSADNCPNIPNTDQAITTGDTAGHACNTDIDDDNDGLIEIWTLEQLHNMRYNLAGTTYDDELADTGTNADAGITTGAPTAATADCTTATGGVYLCGYELMNNLDFDLDGDGSTLNPDGTLDTEDNASPHFVVADGGWEPIGTSDASAFTAIFEGNGFTISNLAIRRDLGHIGLFGSVAGAHIRNVGIIGGLIAYTGSSSSINTAGALAGNIGISTQTTTVSASYATVNIDVGGGAQGQAGGLIGRFASLTGFIIASYATGNVDGGSGRNSIGGLVGQYDDGSIIASYATGTVTGGAATDNVGGLVGRNSRGRTTASYATGNVSGGSGNDTVGGLIGVAIDSVTASYATGNVDGGADSDRAGALVGLGSVTSIVSYGFGDVTNEETAGVSTKPAGVTAATALTAANTAQCSNRTYTTETACTSTSLAITAGTWDSTDMECSAPDSGATAGVDYTTYTTMATCTAPGTKTTAHTWTTWSNAADNTLNAWVFGTGVTPKLRYADYDGAGTTYDCSLFLSIGYLRG